MRLRRSFQGDVEREASAATNMRKIVNRLPNDLIAKLSAATGLHACRTLPSLLRCKLQSEMIQCLDCSDQDEKQMKKTRKVPPPPRLKDSTISSTQIDKPTRERTSAACAICNSVPHRLQQCPVIKQCDCVAVRRQYAASYGFCFNCGRYKPNHSGSSCPEPPRCTKCPGRHLLLLHKENNTGHHFRPKRNTDSNGNVNQENPPAPTMVPQQGTEQGVRPQASKKPSSSNKLNQS